jgi:alginate O-acetyltransferase complex protein AlgI
MLFHSLHFALFLPIVFILYWLVCGRSLKAQNLLLLVASYYFYASWDYRFLALLVFSTLLDYYTGLRIAGANSRGSKKGWLFLSIGMNLGLLLVFKYFNFFSDSFAALLAVAGFSADAFTLNLILPIGISFYTFHGLSYVLDIYQDKVAPTRNYIDYSLFVGFFPLLIAGPIERATHLLPQVQGPRVFSERVARDGLRQILWGLVKKIVIADSCALYVDQLFSNPNAYTGSTLWLGAFLFALQIYGDFSGYSDIAIGTARLFGFDLLRNFAFPYFSRDIAEFWRRWHLSLSSWFRDYLYIPLGGSRGGVWSRVRNTFIVFLVSGFWHGANWTFVAWGALHALYFTPLLLWGQNRRHLDVVAAGKALPSIKELARMGITFGMVLVAWVFFRAPNLEQAAIYLTGMFSPSIFAPLQVAPTLLLVLIGCFLAIEWWGREGRYALERPLVHWSATARWSFYYLLLFVTFYFSGHPQPFIYFQF